MKVALCISGLMRTYQKVSQSLIEKVIIPNNADLFISTWNVLGTGTYKTPGKPWNAIQGTEYPISASEITKFYGNHLKTLQIEDWELQQKFHAEVNESHRKLCERRPRLNSNPYYMTVLYRLLSMHYKIHQANQLRKDYEVKNDFTYDVVIRGRPDLNHEKMLNVQEYNASYPNIYTDLNHNYKYICDQFAFGSSEVMDCYSSIDLLKYHEEGKQAYNAEKIMQYHLEKNNLKINQIDVGYKTVGLIER